jgi:hypothetical protein
VAQATYENPGRDQVRGRAGKFTCGFGASPFSPIFAHVYVHCRLNLQSWLPTEFHKEINHLLVGFGQVCQCQTIVQSKS